MLHYVTSLLITMPKFEEERLVVKNMLDKENAGYDIDYRTTKKIKVYPNNEEDSYLMSDDAADGSLQSSQMTSASRETRKANRSRK